MGRHFFVFSYSTFHPKHLTLNIQHLTLFKRTPFAFQNESFYHAKGVLLLFKTSPFASQNEPFCKPKRVLLNRKRITIQNVMFFAAETTGLSSFRILNCRRLTARYPAVLYRHFNAHIVVEVVANGCTDAVAEVADIVRRI